MDKDPFTDNCENCPARYLEPGAFNVKSADDEVGFSKHPMFPYLVDVHNIPTCIHSDKAGLSVREGAVETPVDVGEAPLFAVESPEISLDMLVEWMVRQMYGVSSTDLVFKVEAVRNAALKKYSSQEVRSALELAVLMLAAIEDENV